MAANKSWTERGTQPEPAGRAAEEVPRRALGRRAAREGSAPAGAEEAGVSSGSPRLPF